MSSLHRFKTELARITDLVKAMLDVDAAIFDPDSRLLAATGEYLDQKGRQVHAPSIQEALANGNVMVNKPGHMPACKGCRFIGNCPAKVEILKSIGKGSDALGVMTLTSFTDSGHDRITENTRAYVDALNLFSDWIADLASTRSKAQAYTETDQILTTLMEMSGDAVLFIDPRGMVSRGNARALKRFAFCDLYTRSLYHLLPEPVVAKILDGSELRNLPIQLNQGTLFVSARPVYAEDRFTGAMLTFSTDAGASPGHQPVPGSDRQDQTSQDRTSQDLDAILGQSPAIARIKEMAKRLARSGSTILITGETGTGKGLLAKAIHNSGSRSGRPFVPVNCAAIPDTLFESELFGYEEGAFTGAKKGGKPGRFELAHTGTLFLDEIGEMPLHLQAKLLNVLQDSALQRVGGIQFIPVDVRVIAATNQDLDTLVKEKKFRSDLFYRLNVIPMDLPPLAGRSEDIPLLCRHFLDLAAARAGKANVSLSRSVLALFSLHHWPGNIRELQNVIEFAVNMAQSDRITREDLPERFLAALMPGEGECSSRDLPLAGMSIRDKTARAEFLTIQEHLDRFGRDLEGKKQTAQALGISLRTLYRKLKLADAIEAG